MAQSLGQVNWFNNAKGFGFLEPDGGSDVFVYYSAIQMESDKSLKEGEVVERDIVEGGQAIQTDKVRRKKQTV